MIAPTPRSSRRRSVGITALALLLVGSFGAIAHAQQELDELLQDLGTVARDAPSFPPGQGGISGQVFHGETGSPIQGVTVIVQWPAPADGSPPRQEVRVTNAAGAFEFGGIPAGSYDLSFIKSGFRASTMTTFVVEEGQDNVADFPLPPLPTETSSQVLELEAFVVEASTVDEIMASLELRMDADELLNVMSAEELSRFAAGDVAEALKRVAGVNVVEGQFAIIRGLEDRYSSTLYNGTPVPSPDPDRQSVQLDLFPSDVVDNLVVAKTFSPDLPSNSAGGAIDIVTYEYPEELEVKISAGSGWESYARDRFLEFESGSPVGNPSSASDVIESDFGGSVGGRAEVLGRELRFKGVANWEIDYRTKEGFQEEREPRLTEFRLFGPQPRPVTRSGGLVTGDLELTKGRFELLESERSEQKTGYLGLGIDLDTAARHRVDGSWFHTEKTEDTVQEKENGFLPGFDYGEVIQRTLDGDEVVGNREFKDIATLSSWISRGARTDPSFNPDRGPLWYSSFLESRSFERERQLDVYALQGDHEIGGGLRLHWAANQAETTQTEIAQGARIFYEPDDPSDLGLVPGPDDFPVQVDELGSGRFATSSGITFSENDISEDQDFARIDAEYEAIRSDLLTLRFSGGGWYEKAAREVGSEFLESPTVSGSSQLAVLGDTLQDLGTGLLSSLDQTAGDLSGIRRTSNESEREIEAWHVGSKATLWERFDLLGGVRVEDIRIQSTNSAFTGGVAFDGSPDIFPTKYLFFDRLDNPARSEVLRTPPPGTAFNDQLLGIDVPLDPGTGLVDLVDREAIEGLVNGLIDERKVLPSAGFAWRPLEGLNLRGAWSKTVARPSFRELGYYVSVEPGSDDLIVGNPQLQLSEVESFDARLEYTWGPLGDLFAFSAFHKTIANPIESIVVRNPLNLENSGSALFQTFFNNPNEATLWGVEIEARKHFDFIGFEIGDYFSIGGNFTWIDAEVDRTEAELARSQAYFGVLDGDTPRFTELEKSRRLFGQPEWIANVDLSFDHPDWGTRATLAFFAISDVLDSAGSATLGPDFTVRAFTLDRYVDSFHQLDLVLSQELWRGLKLKASIKNLTDSRRQVIYDPDQTRGEIAERSYKVGRDFSFSATWTFTF